ncbi:MAG: Zn-dependent oxidoreductase [Pseudonocardiales bacterium]|nr:MAG: Zn-dependent oxidoreductase [Pseudonocardiales bacterium]
MLAAYAARIDPDDPLAGLEVGEVAEPDLPNGWTTVSVRAAALNHHDLWSLRGVGLSADRLPMVLGADAAGVDEQGRDVVVYAVIGDASAGGGDETLDAKRTLLSELHPGTLAERVAVPRGNLVAKPAELSFAEAACLPTAWLTAYRMLVTRGGLRPGDRVLVQGAGGGVSTAAIVLGKALGATVYATSRDQGRRERAAQLGAQVFETGGRLPERVDIVIETVGAATFDHSLKCLRPGGRLVVSGATSGHVAMVDLRRVFFLQTSIVGSTMGTLTELKALLALCVDEGLRPLIDSEYALADARSAFDRLAGGEAFGKIVLTP